MNEMIKKQIAVKWLSKVECNFCEAIPAPYFIDGATVMGPWALMCPKHFKQYGVGLGLGKGQKYDAVTLEKVEG